MFFVERTRRCCLAISASDNSTRPPNQASKRARIVARNRAGVPAALTPSSCISGDIGTMKFFVRFGPFELISVFRQPLAPPKILCYIPLDSILVVWA